MDDSLFRKFAPVLTDPMPPRVRDPRLLMGEDGRLKVYYAPFEHVNPDARIVLVGIAPGPTQMVNANNEARRSLQRGFSIPDAMARAKLTASFSGEPMRTNLIKQLDHWGVPQWLGIKGASSLFGAQAHLVQSTSLLRFPTFVSDADYAGTPNMVRNAFLRSYLDAHFVEEVRQLPQAVFFGLGPKVHAVLEALVREGAVDRERVISGMLHPSGNNTYRITYLTGDRAGPVPHATNPVAYDAGRASFLKWIESFGKLAESAAKPRGFA